MGLIADTSVFIQGKRSGKSALEVIESLSAAYGRESIEASVVTLAELTHGIYRAKSVAISAKRRRFIEDLRSQLPFHDVTQEIATLTGRIEGEQAAKGIAIAFQDLVIGATAHHLDYSVLTSNTKHFSLIPNLTILPI